uniref:Uncharacterized protein n=1 Tax=Trichobilharzia regenti TaxID=157069 RepID=A0AA85JFJ9_TRIRE|nr:unnamed protein product [Trichobilharzia regenti]
MSGVYDKSKHSILYFANRIGTLLGFDVISDISDINIEFFEYVLRSISDFKCDSSLENESRWQYLLQSLSNLMGIPLEYISAKNLCADNRNDLHNLLEIIDLLTEVSSFSILNNFSDCNHDHQMNSIVDDSKRSKLHGNVSYKLRNDHNTDSEYVSVPISFSDFRFGSTNEAKDNLEYILQSTNKAENSDTIRLAYLREKLKDCLSVMRHNRSSFKNTESWVNTVLQPDSVPTGQQTDMGTENGFSFKENDHGVGSFFSADDKIKCPSTAKHLTFKRYKSGCSSVIKPHAKPLVEPLAICRKKHSYVMDPNSVCEENQERSEQPFNRILKAFPRLDLDGHEEHILQRKALSVIKQFSDNFPTDLSSLRASAISKPGSLLRNVEETQKHRLCQLLRHDRQIDNLRKQRAIEAVERRIRAEARERKFQLIRAKKYFDEFVREFRLKKLSKINADEQISCSTGVVG